MENKLFEPTMYMVKGLLILDNDGNRIIARYYDPTLLPTYKEQRHFEKNLFNKTYASNTEIILLDVKKMSVLNCLYESVSQILRKNVEKKILLEHLDAILLAVDEICDKGVILEIDPNTIMQKSPIRVEEITLSEHTVAQMTDKLKVLQNAKEQIKWSLLK